MQNSGEERRVAYVVSNELVKISSQLPSNRNRSFLVHSLVKAFGLLKPPGRDSVAGIQPLRPLPAQFKELSAYHDRDYLERLLQGEVYGATNDTQHTEYGLEEDCPAFPHLPDYVRYVAGATLAAARALKDDTADISVCWDGGRHHAQKARASGFCYVADCVLAILLLKRSLPATTERPLFRPRVMYLDFDLHFADGVSEAFYSSSKHSSSPQVLTLSIHHTAPGFFPVSHLAGLTDPQDSQFDPFTLSLPLERGASNKTFHRIWPLIEHVKDAFQPHYVVVQCGADGLSGDPYATWNWSLGGEGGMGWCVDRICHWPSRTLLLGGGGYNSPNVARAWTFLTSIALGRILPLDSDIPDHGAFPLYASSFTLDVPSGNIQDQNTDAYLERVDQVFAQVVDAIREKMRSSS
ncbi:histone deacetylase complex protein [Dichomitus squalens]|uniref:Histone deacetylase 8 n=2 Tax=Dichomitus squalens TaxID=114155 RepID=A0A4Q9P2V3_9APHY|nr:histone deacetylase complex protein [Dichomitus squalens LYAD-421 SS1]EJF58949.1 histone deacetylase complex protein [Dichomitus squalens LYAD-421 SS1]TBU47865.1 histone deacetylase complex protein [Dichomitus squalens]TBU56464.1 histone deacetylase complex protein [Dichomitus squalens]